MAAQQFLRCLGFNQSRRSLLQRRHRNGHGPQSSLSVAPPRRGGEQDWTAVRLRRLMRGHCSWSIPRLPWPHRAAPRAAIVVSITIHSSRPAPSRAPCYQQPRRRPTIRARLPRTGGLPPPGPGLLLPPPQLRVRVHNAQVPYLGRVRRPISCRSTTRICNPRDHTLKANVGRGWTSRPEAEPSSRDERTGYIILACRMRIFRCAAPVHTCITVSTVALLYGQNSHEY